jgi:Sec7-like guanine-nucleotide exchange factor
MRKIDFTNQKIYDSMRVFLTEGGFRLPPEAQKIDRMLECFSEIYHQQNPGKHDSAEAIYVLANAILMLNTASHNPLLKEKERINLSQFDSMVSHIEGCNLSKREIEDIYEAIQVAGFKIDFVKAVDAKGGDEKEALESQRVRYDSALDRSMRKALNAVKESAVMSSLWSILPGASCKNEPVAESVAVMFSASWSTVLATLSARMEISMRQEISLVGQCFDGLQFLLMVAIRLKHLYVHARCDGRLAERNQ